MDFTTFSSHKQKITRCQRDVAQALHHNGLADNLHCHIGGAVVEDGELSEAGGNKIAE